MKLSIPSPSLSISGFQASLERKLRRMIAGVLYRWVLHVKSQPMAATPKSMMVFSPHQDDETLGCGGLIALKRSQGIPVYVVFLTDGRYGRPYWIDPDTIVQVRHTEAITALGLLDVAPSHIHFLDLLDGSLSDLPDHTHHHVLNQLADLLRTHQPEELYVPHRRDNHPDHEATFKLVQAARSQAKLDCELFQYPIWLFWQSPRSLVANPQQLAGAYRVAIGAGSSQKHQAIATYQSQIPGLTAGFLKRFFSPYEIFFK